MKNIVPTLNEFINEQRINERDELNDAIKYIEKTYKVKHKFFVYGEDELTLLKYLKNFKIGKEFILDIIGGQDSYILFILDNKDRESIIDYCEANDDVFEWIIYEDPSEILNN
ncbi:MAG TPA: hypothetical protein P5509_09975 [Bacteroidales bacterium]|nr:hypothetical protein [Bacteroidales bacterium]